MTGKALVVAGGDGTPPLVCIAEVLRRALGEVPPKATNFVSLARAAAEAGEEHARVEELRVALCLHRCPRHAGRAVIAAQQR